MQDAQSRWWEVLSQTEILIEREQNLCADKEKHKKKKKCHGNRKEQHRRRRERRHRQQKQQINHNTNHINQNIITVMENNVDPIRQQNEQIQVCSQFILE